MNIIIYRAPAVYGKLVSLDVTCNGNRVGCLVEGEELSFAAEREFNTVQVRVQNCEGSQALVVPSHATDFRLECGANLWPLFDFLNLSYLPGLRDHAYYLRPSPAVNVNPHSPK